jgi:hypothetical protein
MPSFYIPYHIPDHFTCTFLFIQFEPQEHLRMGSDNHRSESILWKMHCKIRTIEEYGLSGGLSDNRCRFGRAEMMAHSQE